MNGNGELTETENVILLRKLRNSYGILTDERNSYVLLQRTTAIRLSRNGNRMLETTHYSICGLQYTDTKWIARSSFLTLPALRAKNAVE